MINYSFTISDLEYFLLILVRLSCFVYVAPFFSNASVPRMVKIAVSVFMSVVLYQVLTPNVMPATDTVTDYAIVVLKEAITGLLLGFAANICTSVVSLSGSIADMEVGLSMVSLMDPSTRENITVTGVLYQYAFMFMLILTGMYRYIIGSIADSFTLIPIGKTVFNAAALYKSTLNFLAEYVILGFRIILPIFCVILLLNAVMGIMAKVSPQMNMFAVGMQLKVLVGLSVLFLTASLMPIAADYIFQQMQAVMIDFTSSLMAG